MKVFFITPAFNFISLQHKIWINNKLNCKYVKINSKEFVKLYNSLFVLKLNPIVKLLLENVILMLNY